MSRYLIPYATPLENDLSKLDSEKAMDLVSACIAILCNVNFDAPKEINPVLYYLVPALKEIQEGEEPDIALFLQRKNSRPKERNKIKRDLEIVRFVTNLEDQGIKKESAISKAEEKFKVKRTTVTNALKKYPPDQSLYKLNIQESP